MRRAGFVALMAVGALSALGGLGVILWGAVVAAFVTSDGNTPGDVPGLVLYALGAGLMYGGAKLTGFAGRRSGLSLFDY